MNQLFAKHAIVGVGINHHVNDKKYDHPGESAAAAKQVVVAGKVHQIFAGDKTPADSRLIGKQTAVNTQYFS